MTQIKDMTEEDIKNFDMILGLSQIKGYQVTIMQNLLIKYVDKNCVVCPSCSGQIRFAHKRIVDFYERNVNEINELRMNNN